MQLGSYILPSMYNFESSKISNVDNGAGHVLTVIEGGVGMLVLLHDKQTK